MKICKKCGETKNESEFYKHKSNKDGLFSTCKSCQKEYYKNNKDKINEYQKEYQKELQIKNKIRFDEYQRDYKRNRRKVDPNYKLSMNLRSRIRLAIKSQHGDKAYKSIELLGCTIDEARLHLESLFQPGMTWENHGMFGWHIDHIIPCDAFDLTDPEQQKQCFHYTNLRPLWATDNLKKSNKIIS
jgi:hypothetical protein